MSLSARTDIGLPLGAWAPPGAPVLDVSAMDRLVGLLPGVSKQFYDISDGYRQTAGQYAEWKCRHRSGYLNSIDTVGVPVLNTLGSGRKIIVCNAVANLALALNDPLASAFDLNEFTVILGWRGTAGRSAAGPILSAPPLTNVTGQVALQITDGNALGTYARVANAFDQVIRVEDTAATVGGMITIYSWKLSAGDVQGHKLFRNNALVASNPSVLLPWNDGRWNLLRRYATSGLVQTDIAFMIILNGVALARSEYAAQLADFVSAARLRYPDFLV